jgi:hypothetical protein
MMTKLTIKIDENISLTGTIVTEEDGAEEYDIYYYQPECPFGANCEYAGNILLPMESNIAGNIAPTLPTPPGWRVPKAVTNQWASRDLQIGGNLMVNGNIDTFGNFNGVGSLTSIAVLDEAQTPPTPMWTGRKGEMALHGNFVYLCTDPNTWIRWSVEKTW